MAMLRYGSATIVEPNISSDKWTQKVCCGHKGCSCGGGNCRVKIARNILAKYSPEKYLISHATIIAAVDVENAPQSKSKYKDYLIHPAYSKLVNNNGDAWTKKMLAASYRTFVGADNFTEHVQIKDLSKGKVVDAVLREVSIGKDKTGKDLTTYYCDILVATDRKHRDLIRKIEAGEIDKMSMGCKIAFSICSKCGNMAVDETQACDCVKYEKNNVFYDTEGTQRKIAELCGHHDIEDSVTFVDASWVANPAFTGAVVRNIVNPPEDIMAKIKAAEDKKSYEYEEGDFLKAAHKKAQQSPIPEETGPDKAPPTPDKPEEEPAEPEKEEPTKEAPEEPAAPEEPPEDPVKTWKNKIKQKLLDEIGNQIVQEFSGEPSEEGPRELETLDESLIQPTAALRQMWQMKKSWDKYLQKAAGNLDKKNLNKLRFGSYMILTSNDLTSLKDYGYNRRDFLAVMSFVDQCLKTPLKTDVKKAIASIGCSQGKTVNELISSLNDITGRKLTSKEGSRALAWLRLMDFYQP
jgi:hypothetical protein